MFKQIIVVSLLVVCISGNLTGWRNCGSPFADIHAVRVGGCPQTPCLFIQGESYLIEFEASSRVNTNSLNFVTVAQLLGVPITVLEGNACNHLRQGSCPILAGNRFTFSVLFEVPFYLPRIPNVITTRIWNDFGDEAICIQFDVVVFGSHN
ncbi:NPC intracellular cholesterol transporter 2-like [Bradysia coprophila]|uniref:NPC intracellular cholesterol transporter 2-like n=1 Tax=Bradysia coprophila TaxID=38358 RepID=UPI00187DD6C9|nr:NPC intracellular cholesterol transporter 2-like [Bradysia coprophila]